MSDDSSETSGAGIDATATADATGVDLDRRTVLRAAGLAGAVGVGGFAGGGLATQQQRLTWWAGGTGGTYFPLSNEFKTIVEANTDFTLQVQSTGASVENVGGLARGDADFALIQNDIAFFAYNGTGIDEFEGNPVRSLRGVATLYPETIHVVTLADSGIESLSDLEGATINTGDLGSGTQVNALQILETVGVENFTEQNSGFAQASDQLRNGDIDAAFVVGGWPVGAIAELATTNDIRIVPIEGDAREQLLSEFAFYAEDAIPAGTYSGVDEEVPTVAVQAMIATREGLDAEVVEAVTAALFENADQLTIKSDFIGVDSALDGMSIPLHPGAVSYFESAGVSVPANMTVGNQTAMPAGNATGNETATADGNETAGDDETDETA